LELEFAVIQFFKMEHTAITTTIYPPPIPFVQHRLYSPYYNPDRSAGPQPHTLSSLLAAAVIKIGAALAFAQASMLVGGASVLIAEPMDMKKLQKHAHIRQQAKFPRRAPSISTPSIPSP